MAITATTKKELKRLVDQLPHNELYTAHRFLEYLVVQGTDAVLRAIQKAPVDDEPLTAEDIAALREADEDIIAGRVVPHEEARRRLLGQ
mgnify:CR=1 FL=1